MKTQTFNQCSNLQELMVRFKQLAEKHHPSRGGDKGRIKELYNQYRQYLDNPLLEYQNFSPEEQKDVLEYPKVLLRIMTLSGVEAEICGTWIWVSGNTLKHKESLKKMGLRYSPNKKRWYWRSKSNRSYNRKPLSMNLIRKYFGTDAEWEKEAAMSVARQSSPAYGKLSEIKVSYSRPENLNDMPVINCSSKAHELLKEIWSDDIDRIEEFVVLCLTSENRVLGWHHLSKGGLTGTVADIRIIYQIALKTNARSVIVAHNHPSGNFKPSKSDLNLTHKIVDAGKLLDINFLDHIIHNRDGYTSFADEGLVC